MKLLSLISEVNKQMKCDLLIRNIKKKIESMKMTHEENSIELDATVKKLRKSNGSYSIGIAILEDTNGPMIDGKNLFTNLRIEFIKWLKSFLKKNQYFIEFIESQPLDFALRKIVYYIEENHGVTVKKLPRFIYHLTAVENLESIKKNGLIPKTEMKIEPHPKRIYCLIKLNNYREFEQILLSHTKTSHDYLVLLKIDTNKIHNQFYLDNDLKNGIYTDEKIDPRAIRIDNDD